MSLDTFLYNGFLQLFCGSTPMLMAKLKATFQNTQLQSSLSLDERKLIRKKAKKQLKIHPANEGLCSVEINSKKWQVLFFQDDARKKQFYLIEETKKLGKGAQGEVVLAIHCEEEEWAAVKIMRPKSICFDEDFKRETQNLSRCGRLLGAVMDKEGNAYLIMHYFSGTNLLNYLYTIDETKDEESPQYFVEKKTVDYKLKLRFVVQLLEEVIRLHGLGLAHRDLKTANLILDKRGLLDHFVNLKLVDFGTAVYRGADKPENFTEMAGTFGYNDPYLKGYYDYSNDMFPLGVVIAEIFTDYNYQAALKTKRSANKEVGSNGKMEELTLKDIQECMPDMFVYPRNEEEESPEEKIKSNVLTQIKSLIFLLMPEEITQRPSLDKLKEYHQSLKSLLAKATIESSFHNPRESYNRYAERRGSSPRLLERGESSSSCSAAAAAASSPLSPKSARGGEKKESNGESTGRDDLNQLATLLEQASLADYTDPSFKPTLSRLRADILSGDQQVVSRGLTFLTSFCKGFSEDQKFCQLRELKEKADIVLAKNPGFKST